VVGVSAEQTSLNTYVGNELLELTPAEREVYREVERGDYGVREFARATDREPGTIGNLLRRAREKIGRAE